MKQHEYDITVKHIADAKGNASTYTEALQFKAYNHDDIFKVLGFIQNSKILDDESAKAFAVGLKLFGEVMLENKELPLFKEFMPQFIEFMKTLKRTAKSQTQG